VRDDRATDGEARQVSDAESRGSREQGAHFEQISAVADAILYEGYLLYPYRRSSQKNRMRWQFGVLAPRGWVERDGPVAESLAGSVESWQQQTECLVEPTGGVEDALIRLRVRFLQLQAKGVQQRHPDGEYTPVESLDVAGEQHLSFDEAVPASSDIAVRLAELLQADQSFPVGVAGGEEVEYLGDGGGRLLRTRWPVSATTTLHAERLDTPFPLYRLRVRTENTGTEPGAGASRDEALRRSLVATHVLLGGEELAFVSLVEPQEWAEQQARACHNIHTFPVLAGETGSHDQVLSSPILLYDYPRVAPESSGDLHEAGEIDEILSLRTLTLTDEEKREARATDPRAAAIVDRVDGMPEEVMARLHGAIRSLRPAGRQPEETPTRRSQT
jgi:hypothetical protein